MSSRILIAVVVTLVIGSQAKASILSASSEAVREPSPKAVESWDATAQQHYLNASLLDAAEASSPAGPLASKRSPVSGGGFLVLDGASARATYAPFAGSSAVEGLFDAGGDSDQQVGTSWDSRGPIIAANHGRGGRGGHNRDRDRDRDRRRDRQDPYATPEPSTWVLFGSGLLLLGAYAGLRRRDAMNV